MNSASKHAFCRYLLQMSLLLPLSLLLGTGLLIARLLSGPWEIFVLDPLPWSGSGQQTLDRWILNPALPERFQQFLRRSGISLLPLLVLVIRRRCDLVGPRLCTAAEVQELCLPAHRADVLPGLISSYQLKVRMNMLFQSEAEIEQQYLSRRGMLHDCGIFLRYLLAGLYGATAAQHRVQEQIGGVPFINLSQEELVSAIMLALRLQCRTHVAFVNPDCVNKAQTDAEYKSCLQQADWVCPDGIGMRIAGHLLGREVRQNLNGTDLLPALCKAIENSSHAVYLLGAKPGVAEKMAQCLQSRFPGLRIAGAQHGYFAESETARVIADIRAANTAILLVGFGAPKQDIWIHRHLAASGACVGIGVGGLFDFYSGNIPRAPLWMREIGMEWVYRLIQEPQRMWRRYLIGNIVFLHRVISEKLHSGKRSMK